MSCRRTLSPDIRFMAQRHPSFKSAKGSLGGEGARSDASPFLFRQKRRTGTSCYWHRWPFARPSDRCRHNRRRQRSFSAPCRCHTAERILVADDHPIFRDGMCRLVGGAFPQADIVEAGNVDEIMTLANDGALPALFILDLMFPGMDPLTTIRALRSQFPKSSLIIISMTDDAETIQCVMRQGADGFIGKAMPSDAMLSAIKAVRSGDTLVLVPATASIVPPATRPTTESGTHSASARRPVAAGDGQDKQGNRAPTRHIAVHRPDSCVGPAANFGRAYPDGSRGKGQCHGAAIAPTSVRTLTVRRSLPPTPQRRNRRSQFGRAHRFFEHKNARVGDDFLDRQCVMPGHHNRHRRRALVPMQRDAIGAGHLRHQYRNR